jgi:hypothetical protein
LNDEAEELNYSEFPVWKHDTGVVVSDPSKEEHSFSHRLNDDATIDSICPRCFETVGHCLEEGDLERQNKTTFATHRVSSTIAA